MAPEGHLVTVPNGRSIQWLPLTTRFQLAEREAGWTPVLLLWDELAVCLIEKYCVCILARGSARVVLKCKEGIISK